MFNSNPKITPKQLKYNQKSNGFHSLKNKLATREQSPVLRIRTVDLVITPNKVCSGVSILESFGRVLLQMSCSNLICTVPKFTTLKKTLITKFIPASKQTVYLLFETVIFYELFVWTTALKLPRQQQSNSKNYLG